MTRYSSPRKPWIGVNPTSVPFYPVGHEYYPPCNACFYSPDNVPRNHYQSPPESVQYTLLLVREAGFQHFSSRHPRSPPTNATSRSPPRQRFVGEFAPSFFAPLAFAERFPALAYQSRFPSSVANPNVKFRHKPKR